MCLEYCNTRIMGVEGNFYICHTENVDRCEIFMREKKKKEVLPCISKKI